MEKVGCQIFGNLFFLRNYLLTVSRGMIYIIVYCQHPIIHNPKKDKSTHNQPLLTLKKECGNYVNNHGL